MHLSMSMLRNCAFRQQERIKHEILLHFQQNSKLLGSKVLALLSTGVSDSIYLRNSKE